MWLYNLLEYTLGLCDVYTHKAMCVYTDTVDSVDTVETVITIDTVDTVDTAR